MRAIHVVLCGVLMAGTAFAQSATANADKSKSDFKGAGDNTAGAAKDTGHGVSQGAKALVGKGSFKQSGNDFKGTGHDTVGAAKDTGHGTSEGAKYTGRETKKGADKTGHETKRGAHKVAHPDEPAPQ